MSTAVFGLEASYANLIPTAGQQIVFARIRITAPKIQVAGTYTFSHPWGTETINVTTADLQQNGGVGIKFTKDIGLTLGWNADLVTPVPAPGGFSSVLQPGNTMSTFLRAVTPAPPAGWIGDGVTATTFTGSPIAFNKIRLDAPAGTNLDGLGRNFIESTTMIISGHIPVSTKVPLPLSVNRCTCSHILAAESTDVWLTSKTGAAITITDATVGSPTFGTVLFTGSVLAANGKFYTSFPSTAKTVTIQVTDPTLAFLPASKTVNVVDYLTVTPSYSLFTKTMTVTATSSDFFNNTALPPTLKLVGYGPMALDPLTGIYSKAVLVTKATLPPVVTVSSSVGGSQTATVAIVP